MKWPDDSTTPQNVLEEREKLRVLLFIIILFIA